MSKAIKIVSKTTPTKKQMPTVQLTAEDRAKGMALMSVHPESNAAGIVQLFSVHAESDFLLLSHAIDRRCKEMQAGGGIKHAEEMLIAQAYALDSMFANLARRANNQENLAPMEAFLKLALKAQSQCRATLETLAAIKNPPVVFAKQANIAHGPQQVNNGVTSEPARAEENESKPIELLENNHGQRLDPGTQGTASGADPIMATVGKVHRAKDQTRKGTRKP